MLSPLHRSQFPLYRMFPCTGHFLRELYNYILIKLITFHIAACYDNYFITCVTLSTYFPFKSFCKRNKTFMKNSIVRYTKCLNMADDVNLDICFLCKDSVSLLTLVHQHFLLLLLTYKLRTEKHFDTYDFSWQRKT